ncbi:tyrosine--tRNA ligase [Proteiniclasticum sp. QWL-01]|uniref:tyrosine--tRNA ligase n=1 Tax=Proteiniclasticum sp. QWL-01 TaxID=3036945 RepID=UPI002411818A|nr:tyrosine--tRNA ligase [Proteiniclasticum sp. QWL-01]WFF73889.1 tyrosine--tRNA ligase [Proteiniclasticum sp. QWL-01]
MTVFEELTRRGYIKQLTHPEEIKNLLEKDKVVFYIGFDPTADSLHVGHFIALMFMAHMQRAGHVPIALLGAATAMIGDPSGKTDMRSMMTRETIDNNAECMKKQMERLIDFSEGRAIMDNNANWLFDLNYIDFLRDVGVHFSVNNMLRADSIRLRLERGLSFLEFNYMLMQSYDFLVLHQKYNCIMQLGGDDQWSNMLGGMDLIRRKEGKDAFAMTCTLLTNSEGQKMGKTVNGALWLDKNKTSGHDFYQYWRNVDDADVIKCLKLLTFYPIEEIERMEREWTGQQLNEAKRILAFEVTSLIHGKEEAQAVEKAAQALFGSGSDLSAVPQIPVSAADIGRTLLDILTEHGVFPSKSEGRRNIEQGGVTLNDEKISDVNRTLNETDLTEGDAMVRKGKKKFYRMVRTEG